MVVAGCARSPGRARALMTVSGGGDGVRLGARAVARAPSTSRMVLIRARCSSMGTASACWVQGGGVRVRRGGGRGGEGLSGV